MGRVFKPLAVALARALAEKKAEDVSLLHVSRVSPVSEYMLFATSLSRPHLDALEVDAEKTARTLRLSCLRRSRPRSDLWRILDFGGILVHLMTAETREFYALEKLYHGAPRVPWAAKAAARPRAASRAARRHA